MKTEINPELLVNKSTDDEVSLFTPSKFDQYLGQSRVKQKLELYVNACKKRQDVLDHVLLFGPPGLGKTTLAKIIAHEIGTDFKSTSAPALEKSGDLVAILSNLQSGDILFIDEIHRLNKNVEEILYSAMESNFVDIILGQGAGAKTVQLPLNKFTLIGATTKTALLSAPLQTRFGIIERLDFYTNEELAQIIEKNAIYLGVNLESAAALEIGKRARGTPRIAKRLIKRVRDFTQVHEQENINQEVARQALDFLNIDEHGLDILDQKILLHLINDFNGGPVGLETLAAISGEDKDTIEDYCEPFLIRSGLLQKTPRGRKINDNKIIFVDQNNKIKISNKPSLF